jgi:oligopeptide/dipeptide ABC transporter ATP-binding protein
MMSAGLPESFLEVRDLSVRYEHDDRFQPALEGITFAVARGEVIGILGESGSGKTTLALALLRVLPPSALILQGTVRFEGRDLLSAKESELEKIRGAKVSMIFQEPEMTLNPVMKAIDQVVDVIAAHCNWSGRRCRTEARRILAEVCLDPDGRIPSAYPHQLSGGQRQRLAIALALACRPDLLIADEPTASLDSILQVQWLSLMKDLRRKFGLAVLPITHDPAILRGWTDRVLVMYRGRIVEEAGFEKLVENPLHPYTQGLLSSMPPPLGQGPPGIKRLLTIPVGVNGGNSAGCPFEPRCADRAGECASKEPPSIETEDGRHVRCFKYVG